MAGKRPSAPNRDEGREIAYFTPVVIPEVRVRVSACEPDGRNFGQTDIRANCEAIVFLET